MSSAPRPERPTHTLKSNGRFEKVTYLSENDRLLANIYKPSPDSTDTHSGVLIIHGGGFRGKSTFKRLQRTLSDIGIASFAYDSPGIGGSEGYRREETLNTLLKRAHDSLAVFRDRVKLSKLGVLGMSMGADAAIRLTASEEVEGLALLAPAAYPDELRGTPLYHGFTGQIRHRTYDWGKENIFSAFGRYTGPSMVMYGDRDRIIPEDIQDRYHDVLKGGSPENEFIVLGQATHNFLRPHTIAEASSRDTAMAHIARFSIAHFSPDKSSN